MEPAIEKRSDFVRLLAQVQEGRQGAAQRLYEEYGPYVLRVVRSRLQARLRSKFDSIDFAQDVWGSFFTGAVDQYDCATPEDLILLLTRMARNKVLEVTRNQTQRQNRNIGLETSLEVTHGGSDQLPGRQQTPSQIAMSEEVWKRLLDGQPPVYRRVLILLREGYSHARIAEHMGIHLRTVQRIVQKLLS